MTVEDPIADMLTRIRNANRKFHQEVRIPSSKLRLAIARILKEEGYINDYEVESFNSKSNLLIRLKYKHKSGKHGKGRRERERVIVGLERISKSSLRVYRKAREVPQVLSGMGTCVLSTSKGVMTGREAREKGVGGELLFKIW